MNKPRPYSINILMPNGSPDGLRIVSKDHWAGKLLICPRSDFIALKTRKECGGAGIYLLIGQNGSEFPIVYIGETDELLPRLENHFANKEFWSEVIAVSADSQSLNKARVQHLEASLVELATRVKRCSLENGNIPRTPTLSESDLAATGSFLEDLLQIFPLIGLSIFQPTKEHRGDVEILVLEGKNMKASGFDGPDGFTVLKGSRAVLDVTPSLSKSIIGMREDLEKNNIVKRERDCLRFVEDYRFSSSSFASDLILGHPSSGPASWKTKEGISLKELGLKEIGSEDVQEDSEEGSSITESVQLRFWTQLLDKAKLGSTLHARISPSRGNWVGVWHKFYYFSYMIRQHRSLVHLWGDTKDAAENMRIFELLKNSKQEIEAAVGARLLWAPLKRAFKIEMEFPDGGYLDELA